MEGSFSWVMVPLGVICSMLNTKPWMACRYHSLIFLLLRNQFIQSVPGGLLKPLCQMSHWENLDHN